MKKPNHNFCDLNPAAQKLLYQKILQFDLAANLLATSRDAEITSVRKELLLLGHLFLVDNCIDGKTIALFLKQIAEEANIDKDSFYCLNPQSMRTAWTWIKATSLALGDRIVKYKEKKDYGILRDENLRQALSDLAGSTPEEIAIYWTEIDSGQPKLDDETYPILVEVA